MIWNLYIPIFIGIIAIISILVGSFGLGSQFRIKRFIAYSAISHLGFMLFAYISFNISFYFSSSILSAITNLLFFTIIIVIGSIKGDDSDYDYIFAGLYKLNSGLAISFALVMSLDVAKTRFMSAFCKDPVAVFSLVSSITVFPRAVPNSFCGCFTFRIAPHSG